MMDNESLGLLKSSSSSREINQTNDQIMSADEKETDAENVGEEQTLLAAPSSDVPNTTATTASYVYVYLSHFLSAWGSRMWQFGVGILLVNLTPDSLQLTAVFGLTEGVSVLLLGALIGDYIDNSRRLRAAQITLIGRDLFVLLCAAVIYCYLEFQDSILSQGEWLRYVAYALIIGLASAGNLLSVANTITIERDWIVEICASDGEKLATMTATMRGIDLSTQILAPIATGQVMTYAGVTNGALFIAGWNLVSLIFEYFLIMKVYRTVPALRKEKDTSATVRNQVKKKSEKTKDVLQDIEKTLIESGVHQSFEESCNRIKRTHDVSKKSHSKSGCCTGNRLFSGITIIVEGWKTFASYDVMLSGLGLAMLHMTVLGFGNVTVGYAKIQGLSESTVGIMMGGAGFIGILGSVTYPFVRRCIGLPPTGMIALTMQVICLSACVVSIWLPGSPFEILNNFNDNSSLSLHDNCTNVTQTGSDDPSCDDTPLTSVIVLMSGIILARFGLWMADLSITQMFMTSVREQERGVVFGVQNSLNKLMDMMKYGAVVALPLVQQFGYMVIISYAFVFGGWIFYLIFFCRLPRNYFAREKSGYQTL